MDQTFRYKILVFLPILFLPALIFVGVVYISFSSSDKVLEDFSKVVVKVPVNFDIIECERRYCANWIEFRHKGEVFKFRESNPFYSQFEKSVSSRGFLTIWYDKYNKNEIYQVSKNRKIIIPFEKMYNINGFDESVVLVFSLILLLLVIMKLVMPKS